MEAKLEKFNLMKDFKWLFEPDISNFINNEDCINPYCRNSYTCREVHICGNFHGCNQYFCLQVFQNKNRE